jgi:hypothetical protein
MLTIEQELQLLSRAGSVRLENIGLDQVGYMSTIQN